MRRQFDASVVEPVVWDATPCYWRIVHAPFSFSQTKKKERRDVSIPFFFLFFFLMPPLAKAT